MIANQGREGIQKQEKQSNGGTTLRQGPASYSRSMHSNVLEFFCRTGALTEVKDGNFRLNSRFLEHSSVASPPTNPKGSQTLQPSPQMLPSVSGDQK